MTMKITKRTGIALIVLIAMLFGIVAFLRISDQNNQEVNKTLADNKPTNNIEKAQVIKEDSDKILTPAIDTNQEALIAINLADTVIAIAAQPGEPGYSVQPIKEKIVKTNAKRINIALIGVDARLGTLSKRADANHIVSIIPDSGIIEIISIPRDTPAAAGMPDSSGQNKLTIVYATRGISGYLKEAAKIANLNKIDFYIELGFSQAMGIIELLGHRDSKSTLQVLRSRKGLGGDDYQRCFNQGQYIRQMILKHFDKASGLLGELLIRGGLSLVNSNVSADNVKYIVSELGKNGFPKSPECITVRVRPQLMQKFKVYNFADSATVKQLKTKIERFNTFMSKKDTSYRSSKQINIAEKLNKILSTATADTAKRPKQAINKLQAYFDQHAWLQIMNQQSRESIRSRFASILSVSYWKLGKGEQAKKVLETVELEIQLFNASQTN